MIKNLQWPPHIVPVILVRWRKDRYDAAKSHFLQFYECA